MATTTTLCNMLVKYGPVTGRMLLALIFILSGFNKLTGWDGALQYMGSKGLPFTEVLLALSIIIELGGGLLIALGWYARGAALAIFLFLIPVTLIFHPFWADPKEMNSFMKNIAIMGGMLYIAIYGSGPYSIRDPGCERRERERF
ncbi:MAG: DoxX family protein [Pseudomonadota bacterium]